MPAEGSVFDGFTSIIAQDADTHPSYLPESVVAESVNRTFRGGINRTRPSIRNIPIIAGADQSETIVNDILGGSFQGAYPYRATNYRTSDGLLLSVSGVIYFLKIVNNQAFAYKIIEGNDPGMMHTFFVQAEDRAYIQNGYQNAIAWDGVLGTLTASEMSEENKLKLSIAAKKRWSSKEERQKQSKKYKGIKQDPIFLAKRIQAISNAYYSRKQKPIVILEGKRQINCLEIINN